MGSSWEVDEEKLLSSEPCKCRRGTIDRYEVTYGHTKVLRTRTEYETKVNCLNPDCPSKK